MSDEIIASLTDFLNTAQQYLVAGQRAASDSAIAGTLIAYIESLGAAAKVTSRGKEQFDRHISDAQSYLIKLRIDCMEAVLAREFTNLDSMFEAISGDQQVPDNLRTPLRDIKTAIWKMRTSGKTKDSNYLTELAENLQKLTELGASAQGNYDAFNKPRRVVRRFMRRNLPGLVSGIVAGIITSALWEDAIRATWHSAEGWLENQFHPSEAAKPKPAVPNSPPDPAVTLHPR